MTSSTDTIRWRYATNGFGRPVWYAERETWMRNGVRIHHGSIGWIYQRADGAWQAERWTRAVERFAALREAALWLVEVAR